MKGSEFLKFLRENVKFPVPVPPNQLIYDYYDMDIDKDLPDEVQNTNVFCGTHRLAYPFTILGKGKPDSEDMEIVWISLMTNEVCYCASGGKAERKLELEKEILEMICRVDTMTKLTILGGEKTSAFPDIDPESSEALNLDILLDHPESLKRLERLKIFGKLSTIDKVIEKTENLDSLILTGRNVTDIPDSVKNLRSLRSLKLENTGFTELPEVVRELTELNQLILTWSRVSSLPAWISELKNLKILEINNCLVKSIESLPDGFSDLQNLEVLDISGTKISSLPDNITDLKSLKTLNIGGLPIKDLPNGLFSLQSLEDINIRGIPISALPEEFWSLTNLRRLNISSTKITSIPDDIAKLTNLESLDISRTKISKLPDGLRELKHLEILNISETTITELPEWLTDLTELRQLDIHKSMFLSFGRNLSNLLSQLSDTADEKPQTDSTENNITSLPDNISKLTKLEKLDIGYTGISELPEDFCKLSKLKDLSLSHTALTRLPEGFSSLTNLVRLNISATKIDSLPDDISDLKSLERLDISNTQIAELPDGFRRLIEGGKLRYLYIRGSAFWNDPNKVSPEIRNQSGLEQLRYYYEEKSELLNESKIVVVGEGDVGKTSMLNLLINNKTIDETGSETTEGIDISEWPFKDDDGREYTFSVWDFGGQNRYHSTHQFFLSQRALYIVVLSKRDNKEAANLDYWLENIRLRAGEKTPVILVTTHGDQLVTATYDIDEYIKRYPLMIKGSIEISCKEKEDRKKLEALIRGNAKELPLLKEMWNKRRDAIKKELVELSGQKNFITYERYRDICIDNGLTDERDMSSLAKQLNDLGRIVYFEDGEYNTLKSYIALKPEWVTDAVYSVIHSPEAYNGKLTNESIDKIWDSFDDRRYPDYIHGYLFDLMDKFGMSFALSKEERLITDLLPVKAVEAPWDDFNTETETVRLHYNYDNILPAGTMTRFIASINKYLAKDSQGNIACWYKGAYLDGNNVEGGTCDDVRALVELDDSYVNAKGRIKITVTSGTDDGRSNMLQVIREHFRKINRDNNVHPDVMIPCCGFNNCNFKCQYDRHNQLQKDIRTFEYSDINTAIQSGYTSVRCEKIPNIEIDYNTLLKGIPTEKIADNTESLNDLGLERDTGSIIIETINVFQGDINDNSNNLTTDSHDINRTEIVDVTDNSTNNANIADTVTSSITKAESHNTSQNEVVVLPSDGKNGDSDRSPKKFSKLLLIPIIIALILVTFIVLSICGVEDPWGIIEEILKFITSIFDIF